jgi:YrbI family 3-deoxy-D-manno-octulosonate 8-phosphate phosphatase
LFSIYKKNYIVSILPARGGSKGIPRKNLKKLCGRPLIAYSITQSRLSRYVDQTIVSTEDSEVAEVSKEYGAKVLLRPNELATDLTPTEPVLINVLEQLSEENIRPDYVVLLQPTSPIRRPNDIDYAIETLIDGSGDSLLSVRENNSFFWSGSGESLNYDHRSRPRRQDKRWELIENGSIYLTKTNALLTSGNRLSGRILTYIMPDWASFEIDSPFDFELVGYIMQKKLPFVLKGLDKIQMVIFDVDGVLTDASVYLDEQGNEMLKFSRIDGKGIELLQEVGMKVAVITSENSKIVMERMKKLNINHVYVGVRNKGIVYESLKKELGVIDEEIAYCGDDLGDLPVLKKVGFAACPKNAAPDVLNECHYISPYIGGSGFARDVCNLLLNSKEVQQNEKNKN